VKKTFRYVVTISTVVLCIAFLIFQTMPMTIISIFGSDSDVYNEFAIKCLKIFLLMLPIGALQMTSGVFFQALGYPVQSSIVSLAKQIVFQIPAMLILSSIMGVEGALWAGPVGDSLSFLCTLILLLVYWKKIFAEQPTVQEIKEKDADMEVLPKIRTNEDKPLIITISRSYGAGGRAVGKTLASRLGISYYDTEVLTEAAHKSGIDKEYLEFADEKTASHLMMYSAVASAGIQSQELETLRKVAEQAQHEVIESIASQGSCVIVGRRADQILKNDHNLLRVFITMPLEERIQLVSGRDGLSQKEARRKIQRVDKERADYYNSVSDTGWGTPENYDICMDLGNIGTENAVNILLQMVQMRQK
jgi:cytidylate kinase